MVEILRRELFPWENEVLNLVAVLTGKQREYVRTLHLAGRAYYGTLPALIDQEARNLGKRLSISHRSNPAEIRRQIKRGPNWLRLETFVRTFRAIARWSVYDERRAKAFLEHTLPRLLAFTSFTKVENEPRSAARAIERLAEQVGEKSVRIASPLCPPYTYGVRSNGLIYHISGALNSTYGDRFSHAARCLIETFSHLSPLGVDIQVTFMAYSGSRGKNMVLDIGQDVLDFYAGREEEMLSLLHQAYKELQYKTQAVFGGSGVRGNVVSLEENLLPPTAQPYIKFQERFTRKSPSDGHPYIPIEPQEEEIERWLQETLGVKGSGWLYFFIKQERDYAKKQRIGTTYDVTLSALREGLLYWAIQNAVLRSGEVILDLETTANYMAGSLRHLPKPPPVLMLKGWDPRNPRSFGVRQPFTLPE